MSNNKIASTNQATRLLELAINQNTDIEKLEKLLDLQERWSKEQARKAFFEAMTAFQSDLPTIKKLKTASFPTRNGGTMTYNYASLDDIAEQIKPLLARHGLSYRFEQLLNTVGCKITCIVTHKEGHSVACEMVGSPDTSGNKNPIQQSASAITYLRRYTLCGALGITTADDDIDGRLPQHDDNPQNNIHPINDNRSKALPAYPDDSFQKNLPKFSAAIQGGQTADDVIATVETRHLMSNEQRAALYQIEGGKQ